ncbi:hypothetical protein TWF730_004677 [Orbilia blumenaviensis]|uniref:Uncharacterized protein n=1 Tax=Orbilia blumenaviensis TaxID=1796055 RepID=A0AAV9TWY2_9PEZI
MLTGRIEAGWGRPASSASDDIDTLKIIPLSLVSSTFDIRAPQAGLSEVVVRCGV